MTPITYAVPIVIGRERDVTGTWSALAEPRRTADTKSFCIGRELRDCEIPVEHVRFLHFEETFCHRQPFTFTFTLNCHLGKTHNHRPRGDTTWWARRCAITETTAPSLEVEVPREGSVGSVNLDLTSMKQARFLFSLRMHAVTFSHRNCQDPGFRVTPKTRRAWTGTLTFPRHHACPRRKPPPPRPLPPRPPSPSPPQ